MERMQKRVNITVNNIIDSEVENTDITRLKNNSMLVPFFNFFFYIGFTPFKLEVNLEKNQYQFKTHFCHQILSVFTHTVALLYSIYILIWSGMEIFKNDKPKIVTSLDFISNAAATVCAFIFIHILWRKRIQFLQIIERTRVRKRNHATLLKWMVYFIISQSILLLIVVSYFMLNDYPAYSETSTFVANLPFDDPEKYWHIIQLILIIYASVFYLFNQGIFVVLAPALNQVGNDFRVELEATLDESGVQVEKGLQLYRELKTTTDAVQNLFGNHLLFFYIASVSYYAEAPHVLLGKRGDAEKAIFVYFTLSGIVWIWAAEFHHNVRKAVIQWLDFYTNVDTIKLEMRLKLLFISQEISSDPVALSCRYFPVTFKHISSMLGIIATYAIIVFQLHHDKTQC